MEPTNKAVLHRLAGKPPHILGITLLSAFAVMGAILMTPGLPSIASYFHKTINDTQLTVTSFLLGYALGQLIYGPIANRFGRKIALYLGITIASIGSLFSIFASPIESFYLLIIGRMLEALGASAGLVVCITIINDFYFPQEARRVTGFMMLAFAIVPGVAIAIGGILTQYFNWQACFYFLLFYGFMLIIPAVKMPETLSEPDTHALQYQYLFSNYKKIFSNKKLVGYSLCSGLSSACIYVFGAEGPFIGIHLLQVKPATYGLLGLTPFLGTFLGCLINIRLTHIHYGYMLRIAFLLELSAVLIMLLSFIYHLVTLATLLLPMMLFCIGHPILASTSISLAMQQTEDRANGSAIMNFVAMSMPVLLTLLLGILHIAAAWIMPLIFLVALGLILLVYVAFLSS
jgi:Bcr/CflA subfamily drug resistance transporter